MAKQDPTEGPPPEDPPTDPNERINEILSEARDLSERIDKGESIPDDEMNDFAARRDELLRLLDQGGHRV